MAQPSEIQEAIINPSLGYQAAGDLIGSHVEQRRLTWKFLLALSCAIMLTFVFFLSVFMLFWKGVGVWGVNIPVAWGFAIVNFVWWIGIGHAGTFISAFLLLMRQPWRSSINRYAEAMTLFAVACAGVYPILHLGRPWLFYFLLPYPESMGLWPQWRSALVWDMFAVSTYAIVSLLFWYMGMIPDLATMRDRAQHTVPRYIYGILALGWRNSALHWRRYEQAYLLFAGLATPLVISVHSIVSLDFAIALVPGWHSAIFPPYFVAGAILSGFAMVLTIGIPLRSIFKLHDVITLRHLNLMGLMMLATGLMVDYGYIMEHFMTWFSDDSVEIGMLLNRMQGPYSAVYWAVLLLNVGMVQLLWSKRLRMRPAALFVIALLVNLGMWLERFMIVVTSLAHDFLPSTWRPFVPTKWDWATFVGTGGLFFLAFLLFLRWLPAVSIAEVRQLIFKTRPTVLRKEPNDGQ